MPTEKQIQANRLNARKSTGPRTAAGKAISARNALKSGIDAESDIIRGEDAAELETLTEAYFERFRPATVEERHYVDTLIRADWQLRRLTRAEAQIWEYEMDTAFNLHDTAPLGHAFERGEKSFWRIQRRIEAAERSHQRALRELERLQANRPKPLPPSQPTENASPAPQIGFVPPTTPLNGPPDLPVPPFTLRSLPCTPGTPSAHRIIENKSRP
ncbi:MAG: hypothetical protein C5B51_07370 [Terriglobia bacterium]|nr:MAG: hypothetical protein C5B51_07370 [Terriglobia bacterium]